MSVQPEENILVEIPEIQVVIPKQANHVTEAELKEMVWEAHKDTIYKSMKVRRGADSKEKWRGDENESEIQSALENAKQRSLLLDQISAVQRQFLQKKEPRFVFNYLLDSLLDLMDSEYGFIGQVMHDDDGTMYLQSHAVTNIAWNAATRKFYEDNIETGLNFYNLNSLFGHVIVHAKPVIANNPQNDSRACGLPEGHPPLNHFLGIPFFEPGGTVLNGMMGVANKLGGYSEADIKFLEPFTITCSNLIQAYGALQENLRFIDTLEVKVKERTLELELANSRLEQANQIMVEASAAQLRHFACMSHEIRTPLNCIVGLSSLLMETDMTSHQRDSVRMIVSSGELLSTIVNDVLDYSRLISGNVEFDIQPTDLQETLDAVVHSVLVKAKDRNIKLCTHYDPFVPKIIDTDGRRVQQILYNLLGNAIKFSRDDGLVEFFVRIYEPVLEEDHLQSSPPSKTNVQHGSEQAPSEKMVEISERPSRCPFHQTSSQSTANIECADDSSSCSYSSRTSTSGSCPFKKQQARRFSRTHQEAHAPLQERKRFLQFVVKDYGKGIAKSDFAKIFKPFMQASSETEKLYGGTGLGLAITSKLVEGFGGTISVDSEIGQYAEFSVLLPFCRPVADVETMSRLLGDTRIMIVNRDSSQRLPPWLIEAYKLNTAEFESCEELSFLARVKGAIDKGRSYLCLIHEDLYRHEEVTQLSDLVPGITVLTFGPQYSVNDGHSQRHYRSLAHVLPSSFVDSLIHAKTVNAKSESTTNLAVSSNSAQAASNNSVQTHRMEISQWYKRLKVLIAEDNSVNQKVLKSMLARLGVVNMTVVDNGKKAVDASAAEDWHVIFMDMQMPVMDGVEATQLILKQINGRRPPKIIFVTAHALDNFKKEASDAGALGYISKPFNLKTIESTLASLFDDGEFISVLD